MEKRCLGEVGGVFCFLVFFSFFPQSLTLCQHLTHVSIQAEKLAALGRPARDSKWQGAEGLAGRACRAG